MVVPEFSFLMYRIYAKINGAKVVYAKEDNFKININNILKCISKKTKIVFIANPNNPTGTYLTTEELKILHKKLSSRVLLLIDDAYWEYIKANDYEPGLQIFKNAKNVLVTRTFSKIYGFTPKKISKIDFWKIFRGVSVRRGSGGKKKSPAAHLTLHII